MQYHQNNNMLILLALIVLSAAQTCPYCQYNACTLTSQGLANCSACATGTLVTLTSSPNTSFTETLGVCMLCPANCLTCSYGPFWATMGPENMGIYCTNCAAGFTDDAVTGTCLACPANCLACADNLDYTDVECTSCASGYTLGGPSNNFACTATAALQSSPDAAASFSGVTIGAIAWASLMTVVAGVLLVLWLRKGKEQRLLNAKIELETIRT